MLTREEINALHLGPLPENCVGFDREGSPISAGNIVELLPRDKEIQGNPPIETLSLIGKRGTASLHYSFPDGWITLVLFEIGTVACWDFDLRVIPHSK